MINRQEEIKKKGFNLIEPKNSVAEDAINSFIPVDFSKIKVGTKILEDATIDLGFLSKIDRDKTDKKKVVDAMKNGDYAEMRKISEFFFRTSGIYSRLCRYIAYLYRYDWIVTPFITDGATDASLNKALTNFHKVLFDLDNFEVKRFLGEVALKVVKNGCYYGYVIRNDKNIVVQELSPEYCRTRFSLNGKPAIEFNMSYFDTMFKDTAQKMKILNLFPAEFKKGYVLYKEGKLVPQFSGDTQGWYLLDVNSAIKFNLNGDDYPLFMSTIPAIIDLDAAQELDRKRMAQKLLKIIIQKMPIDKNGDLVFDVDEAQSLHNNAVRMLSKAIGIDVLTTFADVDVADMGDNGNASAVDELEKIERAVYNQAGVSQKQFNTDGNLALEKSILNDEASLVDLISQFESFLNHIVIEYNKTPKKYYYKVQILPTTIYNYKDMAKLYKEQTQLGYSKMLPQIALGQSQSSILANAYFENEILDLVNVFIPPLMSSTMNAEVLNRNKGGESDTGGRPEKENDEKSEKTILNEESAN